MNNYKIDSKIIDRSLCKKISRNIPRPLVFTNGVFDILHKGHAYYLEQAANLGSTLIIAVNSDLSVKKLKNGNNRPFNNVYDRMYILAALGFVDFVTSFHEESPLNIIGELKPDFIVKGGDYDMDILPESELVKCWGGRAVSIRFIKGISTTSLVNKIVESQKNDL